MKRISRETARSSPSKAITPPLVVPMVWSPSLVSTGSVTRSGAAVPLSTSPWLMRARAAGGRQLQINVCLHPSRRLKSFGIEGSACFPALPGICSSFDRPAFTENRCIGRVQAISACELVLSSRLWTINPAPLASDNILLAVRSYHGEEDLRSGTGGTDGAEVCRFYAQG